MIEVDETATELVEIAVDDDGEDVVLAAAEVEEGAGVDVEVDAGVDIVVEELTATTAAFCTGADGPAEELAGGPSLLELLLLELLPALLALPSKTSKYALTPFGTVTTQNVAPPAPTELDPTIWLTWF